MSDENILLVIQNPDLGKHLNEITLSPSGYNVSLFQDFDTALSIFDTLDFAAAIIEGSDNPDIVLGFLEKLLGKMPTTYVILICGNRDLDLIHNAVRKGVSDFLVSPVVPEQILDAVQVGISRRNKKMNSVRNQIGAGLKFTQGRAEIYKIKNIGQTVAASLDLDHVLTAIVDAAVKLTDAEEGSLLILDEESGELVMRAARNFQEEFARTFRLPVKDSLAGDVIRRGVPVMINNDTPQKIKTTYLVRTLIYVPLKVQGRVIGVLGVDNRKRSDRFTKGQLSLVSTLADYAGTAIENARLYRNTEVERQKLDSILTQIEDGVLVVDPDFRIILVNSTARKFFSLDDSNIIGKPLEEVFQHEGLLSIFTADHDDKPFRKEIELDEGYVLNIQLVEIPDVGLAATMQDISYFKEIDRYKTQFVNTVSHDLRSPLTAILGYIELIGKVGEVNDQQRAFIKRVQISVNYITNLINDLLELGRIEGGIDTRREFVPLGLIVQFAVDDVKNQIDDHDHKISLEIANGVPDVFGDPVRLRQVVDNLLSNAVRYTPNGGDITVRLSKEGEQVILQVEDSGLGIPYPDQSYIFDRFYRGGNVPDNVTGSGLGLAIVKSIVENHQGRVWVESSPGEGSCFTVVLPVPEKTLIGA
jgi:two-component system NtrC family sensor kinase